MVVQNREREAYSKRRIEPKVQTLGISENHIARIKERNGTKGRQNAQAFFLGLPRGFLAGAAAAAGDA